MKMKRMIMKKMIMKKLMTNLLHDLLSIFILYSECLKSMKCYSYSYIMWCYILFKFHYLIYNYILRQVSSYSYITTYVCVCVLHNITIYI
jgi:hypothetical protein